MANEVSTDINFDISAPSDIICAIINGIFSLENTKLTTKTEYAKIQGALTAYDRYLADHRRASQNNFEAKKEELRKLHQILDQCMERMKNSSSQFDAMLWKQIFETTIAAIPYVKDNFEDQPLLTPWSKSEEERL